jgi:glycine/D-amino acid oxidase-like deaminating enzyme
VLGGGHCGLAMSRRLANRSIDHVVLERGEVANSWRTQRWDSLRLLTPNWMTRLPGYAYRGDDPDGYLTASETAQLIADYAKEIAAPVRANTTVISVRPADRGYVVQTDQDTWHARAVVSASGASAVPYVPHLHHAVSAGITTMAQRITATRASCPTVVSRRGRFGERNSDRRGAAPLRASGHARRRRARTHAAYVSRHGHPVVDGRVGAARRAECGATKDREVPQKHKNWGSFWSGCDLALTCA